jgi:hypothetical protein
MFFKTFGFSLITSAVVLGLVGYFGSPQLLFIAAILAVLEVSLSFDNAVINATVLQRMSPFWQKLFLTLGVLIAVFGMRLLFPVLVVSLTAGLSFGSVVDLALNSPDKYAASLLSAHPAIASFGGAFLLLIFLDFMFEEKDIKWLVPIEKLLVRLGSTEAMSVILTLGAIILASIATPLHSSQILLAGVSGVITYLLVNGLATLFESEGDAEDEDFAGISGPSASARGAKAVVGKAAFFLFLYLEVLDASFSFDGVIGAFAVSNNVIVIAAGLGIGALFIRSLTVFLVRKGTLAEYVYLEHGAHYAIGALAVLLFISIGTVVPDLVTGLTGVFFIGLALVSSVVRNKREAK